MISEVATLQVKTVHMVAFEAAFAQAQKIIAAMRGYVNLALQRCIENDHQYVLLVNWQTLEDHTIGFRQSAQYQDWRRLLNHFYDPFPTMLHFKPFAVKTSPEQSAEAFAQWQTIIEDLKKFHKTLPTTQPVVEQMRRDVRY